MSDLSTCRPVYLTDASPGGTTWKADERTGAIHMRAPLTWTGVRVYEQIRVNGRGARILRRPEQVLRPGYLRTCERLTPTHGHPREGGAQVLIDADNYRRFAVGSVGDKIEIEEINGYPVPVANITVVDSTAVAAIQAGDDQVSQGFFALVAPPPSAEAREVDGEIVGSWEGPHGPEDYDVEHVCDPEHPAAIAYAAENPDFPLGKVGANHIAVGIPAGRGLAQAQAQPLESYDSADSLAGEILFLDESPAPRAAPKAPMKRKFNWSPKLPKGFDPGVAIPFLDELEVEAADGPDMLLDFLAGLQTLITALTAQAATAEGAAEVAQGEAQVAQGAAAAAGEQVATAEGVATEAVAAADALTVERDALLAEVAPLRVAAIAGVKATAAKVAPGVGLDAADSIPAIRRAAVVARLPGLAQATDATIDGAWAVLVQGLDGADAPGPSPGFMSGTDAADDTTPRPANKARTLFAVIDSK